MQRPGTIDNKDEEFISISQTNPETPTNSEVLPTGFPVLDDSTPSSRSELSIPLYTPWQRAGQLIGDFVDAVTPVYVLNAWLCQCLKSATGYWMTTGGIIGMHILEKQMHVLVTKEKPLGNLLKEMGDGDIKLGLAKVAFDKTVSFTLGGAAVAYGFYQINNIFPETSIVPLLGAGGLSVYLIVSFSSKQGIKWYHHKHGIPEYEEEYVKDPKYSFLQISGQTGICIALDLAAMMTILKAMTDGGYEELAMTLRFQLLMMLGAHVSRQLLSLSSIPDLSDYFARTVTREDESDFGMWLSASQRVGTTISTLQVGAGAGLRGLISVIVCSSIYLGMESWCWGNGECKDARVLENLPVLGTVLTIGLAGKAVYDHRKEIGKGIVSAVSKCWSSLFQQSKYEKIPDAPQQTVTTSSLGR